MEGSSHFVEAGENLPKGQGKRDFLGFFTSFIFSLTGITTPYITRFLIDVVFHANRPDLLLPLLIICGIILIILFFTGLISDYVLVNAFERAKLLMRYDLFRRLQKASTDFLSMQRSGELNYRIFGETGTIQGFFNQLLIALPIDLLFIVIISAIMISWNLRMALFVFAVLCLQVLVIIGFQKPLLTYALLQKSKSQFLSGFVVERFRNIQLIRTLNTEEEVIDAAKRAKAYDFIMQLPQGFYTRIGEGGLQLSSGEAQRIALARLFLANPKIVVLDEPTSFLDPETESAIHQAIMDLKKTVTVIVIAHRPSTVKIADQVLVLSRGMVVEQGTHGELLRKRGMYATIYTELCRQETRLPEKI